MLQTLSVLSTSAKVKVARPDVTCWSWSSNVNADQPSITDQEVIYKQLETEADEGTYQEFYYKHHGGSNYGYVWGKQNESTSETTTAGATKESTNGFRSRNYAYLPYYTDEEKGMYNAVISGT